MPDQHRDVQPLFVHVRKTIMVAEEFVTLRTPVAGR